MSFESDHQKDADGNADRPTLFNPQTALTMMGGVQDLLVEVVAAAIQEFPHQFEQLTERLEGNDLVGARRAAHTIHGAARALQVEALMERASRIETQLESGDRSDAPEQIRNLNLLVQQLTRELQAYLENHSDSEE